MKEFLEIDPVERNRDWPKGLAKRKKVCGNCESKVRDEVEECKQCGMRLNKEVK